MSSVQEMRRKSHPALGCEGQAARIVTANPPPADRYWLKCSRNQRINGLQQCKGSLLANKHALIFFRPNAPGSRTTTSPRPPSCRSLQRQSERARAETSTFAVDACDAFAGGSATSLTTGHAQHSKT